jgi:hypothetical protein
MTDAGHERHRRGGGPQIEGEECSWIARHGSMLPVNNSLHRRHRRPVGVVRARLASPADAGTKVLVVMTVAS